ncbi:MAG: hypothetical protein K6T99_12020 [Armatimonadetes bacterium]|nr:hypothetical protein [Armatimonadota bacterium]
MVAYKIICITLAVVVAFSICLPTVQGQSLVERALKLFGIAYVVRTFGNDINRFVNQLASQNGVEWEGTTKVVPIISVGSGAYIGAAQVVGPTDKVDDVRGVGQAETQISNARARLLFPMDTTNPLKNMRRIEGVGVSAILDFKI